MYTLIKSACSFSHTQWQQFFTSLKKKTNLHKFAAHFHKEINFHTIYLTLHQHNILNWLFYLFFMWCSWCRLYGAWIFHYFFFSFISDKTSWIFRLEMLLCRSIAKRFTDLEPMTVIFFYAWWKKKWKILLEWKWDWYFFFFDTPPSFVIVLCCHRKQKSVKL